MVKKIKKYVKFMVCMALIAGLIAPSYAALSASDGSAFVTKAEFDSALADFNARLTTFEAGINSKIDSQVSSYLDRNGIWNGKIQTLECGLNDSVLKIYNAFGWTSEEERPLSENYRLMLANRNNSDNSVKSFENSGVSGFDNAVIVKITANEGITAMGGYGYAIGHGTNKATYNHYESIGSNKNTYTLIQNVNKSGMLVMDYMYRIGFDDGLDLGIVDSTFGGLTTNATVSLKDIQYDVMMNNAHAYWDSTNHFVSQYYGRHFYYPSYSYVNSVNFKWTMYQDSNATLAGDGLVSSPFAANNWYRSVWAIKGPSGIGSGSLPGIYVVKDSWLPRETQMFVAKGQPLYINWSCSTTDWSMAAPLSFLAVGPGVSASFKFNKADVY